MVGGLHTTRGRFVQLQSRVASPPVSLQLRKVEVRRQRAEVLRARNFYFGKKFICQTQSSRNRK